MILNDVKKIKMVYNYVKLYVFEIHVPEHF
jgi:hypothetical protein